MPSKKNQHVWVLIWLSVFSWPMGAAAIMMMEQMRALSTVEYFEGHIRDVPDDELPSVLACLLSRQAWQTVVMGTVIAAIAPITRVLYHARSWFFRSHPHEN